MACDVCMGINSDKCPVCGKEIEYITCPECDGEGMIYTAYHINGEDSTTTTALAYSTLPDTEESAIYLGKKWYKGEADKCPKCYGECEIPVEKEEDWEW